MKISYLSEISQEEAVVQFSELVKPFLSSDSVNPHAVIEAVRDFYRYVRIAGASSDMLLLEWGTKRPFLISSFIDFSDLTLVERDAIKEADYEWQWLGLTRQIFVPDEINEGEFDAGAIALCVHLFFGEKVGGEPASHVWVDSLNELDDGLTEFLRNPFVAQLITSTPSLVNGFVTAIG